MPIVCLNCDTRNRKNARFCYECGSELALLEKEETFEEALAAFWHFLFHADGSFAKDLIQLVKDPGFILIKKAHSHRVLHKAIFFFCIGLTINVLINEYVVVAIFGQTHFKYSLCAQFSEITVITTMAFLLIGIAFIGYITLGTLYRKESYNYNFREVFIISLYIYGVNFTIAPFTVLFWSYLDRWFPLTSSQRFISIVTDIPCIYLMANMLFMLVKKTPNMKWRYFRYILFMLIAGGYYLLMYEEIEAWSRFLKHLAPHSD